MPVTRTTRNRMVLGTVAVLLLGGALLIWEFTRDGTPESAERLPAVRLDPAAVREALRDPRAQALAPLAPPVLPKGLGNPAPFPVPESHP